MKKYIILIPVYNDWQSVFKLIQNIDLQLNDELVEIIIVNDGSKDPTTIISALKSISDGGRKFKNRPKAGRLSINAK